MLFIGLPLIFRDEVICEGEVQLKQFFEQVLLFAERDYCKQFYFNFNAISKLIRSYLSAQFQGQSSFSLDLHFLSFCFGTCLKVDLFNQSI